MLFHCNQVAWTPLFTPNRVTLMGTFEGGPRISMRCIGQHGLIQRIRDPLHDLIEFQTGTDEFENVLWRVVQSRPFQRMRRIKQLGFSDFVYPGASHSRLAHSAGVFFTARRLMEIIRRFVARPEESKAQRALAAALVHDLGHGPFSHAFEAIGKELGLRMADHEHVSDLLIRDSEVSQILNELGRGFADDVADVIQGTGKKTVYRAVVSSQFDADRLDYMRRDRLMTGTQHAGIDFEWLMANLEIGALPFGVDETAVGKVETFVLGPKAIYGAEAFVLGLFQLYPTVYFHKATRGAEKLYCELLLRLVSLCRNGSAKKSGLTHTHPLVRFANNSEDLNCALALDDTVVWGALSQMAEASDPIVSNFALRLRDRKLYKCIDVRTRVAHRLFPDGKLSEEQERSVGERCEKINKQLLEWSKKNSGKKPPRILVDKASRNPYRKVDFTDGPLDRINIRTSSGQLVDLQERSNVVGALKPFQLSRAYADRTDTAAISRIETVIESEANP